MSQKQEITLVQLLQYQMQQSMLELKNSKTNHYGSDNEKAYQQQFHIQRFKENQEYLKILRVSNPEMFL